VAVNPKLILTGSSSTTLTICPGELITLTASGANIYSWSTGEATPMIVVTPLATSGYTGTGIDANGCKATLVFVVNVGCTGIKHFVSDIKVEIYPNPFSDEITLSSYASGLTLELYDATGKKLQEHKMEAGTSSLNLKNYSVGIYFVKFYNSDHNLIKQEKLIKEF